MKTVKLNPKTLYAPFYRQPGNRNFTRVLTKYNTPYPALPLKAARQAYQTMLILGLATDLRKVKTAIRYRYQVACSTRSIPAEALINNEVIDTVYCGFTSRPLEHLILSYSPPDHVRWEQDGCPLVPGSLTTETVEVQS